ncbi:hypothetical protein ACFQMF_11310 [Halorubrum rutilum]|uniref:Uncharacterized protein n=1 Tax=Halorubrum rutilum TaxID=1364933 RepID=A0ABD6AML1_9EURY|nr:hypothetical protein [Halorubrum rutilum]
MTAPASGGESGGVASEAGPDGEAYAGRDAPRKRVLRVVAVQAAVLSAAVHLLWAWPRLGDPGDARPYAFLLGGAFAVAVAVATLRAPEYRRLYALGGGTLAAFLLGYVGWHGAAAGSALASDPLAIVAKGAELVGVAAFLGLYRLAPPTSAVLERRDGSVGGGDDPAESDDVGEERVDS